MLTQPLDQTPHSSSSSSLKSLSFENSADYPPFLFNMLQTTSYTPYFDQHAPYDQPPSSSTMRSQDSLQQTLNQIRRNQSIPSREHEEAEMTRAIIAAISSSSSSSSSSHQHHRSPRVGSAFKRYRMYLGPATRAQNQQNLNRRSLSFLRNLNEALAQQDYGMVRTTRPTSNQLHHMMSERKRREKLNQSFEALRSILPPGSKVHHLFICINFHSYNN